MLALTTVSVGQPPTINPDGSFSWGNVTVAPETFVVVDHSRPGLGGVQLVTLWWELSTSTPAHSPIWDLQLNAVLMADVPACGVGHHLYVWEDYVGPNAKSVQPIAATGPQIVEIRGRTVCGSNYGNCMWSGHRPPVGPGYYVYYKTNTAAYFCSERPDLHPCGCFEDYADQALAWMVGLELVRW